MSDALGILEDMASAERESCARELFVLLIGLGRLVVGAQELFDALVFDGLPVIETLRVPGQETSTLLPARWATSAGSMPAHSQVDSAECRKSYGRFASGVPTSAGGRAKSVPHPVIGVVTDDAALFREEQPSVVGSAERGDALAPQGHQMWRQGHHPCFSRWAVLQPALVVVPAGVGPSLARLRQSAVQD
ncbi:MULTISPECIES: hypothetical protein [unclassified Streptomyces]|uniref:hypothetical protein n=1 Tax=unclassified Streptomyces TaxID=2593676 RepID=UPI0033BE0993